MVFNLRSIDAATSTAAYLRFLTPGVQVTPQDRAILGYRALSGTTSFREQLAVLKVLGEQRKIVVGAFREGIRYKNDEIKKRLGYVSQFFNKLVGKDLTSSSNPLFGTAMEKIYAQDERSMECKKDLFESIPEITPSDLNFIAGTRSSSLAKAGAIIFERLYSTFDGANESEQDIFDLIINALPPEQNSFIQSAGVTHESPINFIGVDLYIDDRKAFESLVLKTFGIK